MNSLVTDTDPHSWLIVRRATTYDETGRGLHLLDAVALRWGVEQGPRRQDRVVRVARRRAGRHCRFRTPHLKPSRFPGTSASASMAMARAHSADAPGAGLPTHQTDRQSNGAGTETTGTETRGTMQMKKLRLLRTRVGISAAAVLLSGAGLSLATASPAAAYAGYCNTSVTRSSALGSVSFVFHAKIPAYNGTMDCYMNQGANSAAVKALQTTLNKCYGRSLTVDGDFGPATKNALEYAQGQADIGVDGSYGTETRRGLKWYWDQVNGSRWGCARLGDVIHIGV